MTKMRALAFLFPLWLSSNGWCQAPLQSAQAASQATPGAFVDVEAGKLYYEECGTGPDAVILIHDGIAHSAVWDDVWRAFCKRFHTIRYDRREATVELPPPPPGTRKRKISLRFSAIER
jgi:hypothetical protein